MFDAFLYIENDKQLYKNKIVFTSNIIVQKILCNDKIQMKKKIVSNVLCWDDRI